MDVYLINKTSKANLHNINTENKRKHTTQSIKIKLQASKLLIREEIHSVRT